MLRLLVLIGAFFLLRAMLPRKSRCSPTATSPYINGLDGVVPTQQLSSMLDEVTPYESWVASRRGNPITDAQSDHLVTSRLK
jgi:hypothetical protein